MASSAHTTKAWDHTKAQGLAGVTAERRSNTDLSGRMVGPYRLVRRLGEGGMSAVYEAIHQDLGRRVAIKLLFSDLAREQEIIDRFFNEARAASIIGHQDIVNIFEVGQLPDGTTYLVMEYLPGEPLGQRLRRLSRIPPKDAVRISRQVASALKAAHEKGIVHRDLKPDNILLVTDSEAHGGERAKLVDFGIAKLAEEHQGMGSRVMTRAGMVLGTPTYMAPEQCRGSSQVDGRADVYSLGVVLFEMLAGRPPFLGEGEGEIVAAHIYEEPPALEELASEVPRDLSCLVARMLEKDRALRPTMAEVASILEGDKVLELPPLPSPDGAIEVPSKTLQGNRRRSVFGYLLLSGLGLSILGSATRAFLKSPTSQNNSPPIPGEPKTSPRIQWTLATSPPGAEVVRVQDGVILGTTPCKIDLAKGTGTAPFLLRKPGFHQSRLELDLSSNLVLQERLEPDPVQEAVKEAAKEIKRQANKRPRGKDPEIEGKEESPSLVDFEKLVRPNQGSDGGAP